MSRAIAEPVPGLEPGDRWRLRDGSVATVRGFAFPTVVLSGLLGGARVILALGLRELERDGRRVP